MLWKFNIEPSLETFIEPIWFSENQSYLRGCIVAAFSPNFRTIKTADNLNGKVIAGIIMPFIQR